MIKKADKEIRVSCAHLSIMQVGDKYAVLKAKGSASPKYSAIGGHMKCNVESRKYLEEHCNARFAEKSNDLILFMAEANVSKFKEWFYTEDGRDSIGEELKEELIEENNILDCLEGIMLILKATTEKTAKSTRKGHEGQRAYYFIDVYRVQLTSTQQEKLKLFAETNDTLALLTKDELKKKEYRELNYKQILLVNIFNF